MGTSLNIVSVSKSFGEVEALKNIDLNVEQGSFVCLLGPSGCGKTTLLRIVAGFEKATEGQLLLDGKDISGVPPHKRDFGMVFQSLALFPHMSVAENIAYGLKLRGVDGKKRAARVDELLEVISLPHIADRPVTALSGGQRQRVAIARALAVQPRLFLLDEPLSALDAQLRDNMQIELRQLQQQFGVTTLLVTHDQTEAMMLADNLVVLRDGEICQAGSPSSVYQSPSSSFVAEFIGASNIVDGVATVDGYVSVLGAQTAITTTAKEGAVVQVSIRAENISVSSPNGSIGQPVAVVAFVRHLGAQTELLLKADKGKQIRVSLRSEDARLLDLQVGKQVALSLDPATCVVFDS